MKTAVLIYCLLFASLCLAQTNYQVSTPASAPGNGGDPVQLYDTYNDELNLATNTATLGDSGGDNCTFQATIPPFYFKCEDANGDFLLIKGPVTTPIPEQQTVELQDVDGTGIYIDTGGDCHNTLGCVEIVDPTDGFFLSNNGIEEISDGVGDDVQLQTGTFTCSVPILTPAIQSTGTTFTLSGCSATSPVGGPSAGQFVSGTTGTCTVVITTGVTAANGWACHGSDISISTQMIQSAKTTTTATLTGSTTSGNTIVFECMAY